MDGNLAFETDKDTGDVTYGPAEKPKPPVSKITNQVELIDKLSEATIDRLALRLTEGIAHDDKAQASRQEMNAKFLELLGLGDESDPSDDEEDDDDADTSDSTLMLTALLRFQAKAYSTLLPSDDSAIRTKPAMELDDIEDPAEREKTTERVQAAQDRVERFYTEYLFERLPSYEDDTDLILHDMGMFGLGIRKVSLDRLHPRHPVCLEYIPLENLILSYDSKNMRTGRITHKIDMKTSKLVECMMSGRYKAVSLEPGLSGEETNPVQEARDVILGFDDSDPDATHRLYEVYCELNLEEDRHAQMLYRPYVVTIHAASQQILSVQRNWDQSDKTEQPLEHFVGYTYHPGKNAVSAIGLGSIMGNVTRALRRAQRRAFDAAYMENHPSGFKLADLSIRDDATRIQKGQFTDVDSPTGDINKAIMPHPFRGPSPGLLQLSDKLEENGRELGGIASIDFSALMKSGVAAGPAMAAYEESTEFQTSVHRRLYKAHRRELKLMHDLMRKIYGNKPVTFSDGQSTLRPEDLMLVDVIPYMKPGQVSKQKSIMEAQAIYEIAGAMPDVLNQRKAAEEYLRALGKANLDELMLPDPEDEENQPQPADPVSEYSMIVNGTPVRAGMHQNHQAHIDAHVSQLRMLAESQMPIEQGEAASAALAAHITEHFGMAMVQEMAARTGIPAEQFGQIPPEQEGQIATMIATATLQLEQERKAMNGETDPQEDKVAVEQVKQEGKSREIAEKAAVDRALAAQRADHEKQMETMRHAHTKELEQIKAAKALDLQMQKDDSAMDREVEDNAAAIKIARMKEDKKDATATSGTRSGASEAAGADAKA